MPRRVLCPKTRWAKLAIAVGATFVFGGSLGLGAYFGLNQTDEATTNEPECRVKCDVSLTECLSPCPCYQESSSSKQTLWIKLHRNKPLEFKIRVVDLVATTVTPDSAVVKIQRRQRKFNVSWKPTTHMLLVANRARKRMLNAFPRVHAKMPSC